MTTKRKPGPAKGTPATGHRQKEPLTAEQLELYARWQLFPAGLRPTAIQMAATMQVHRETFARKMKPDQQGRGLTNAQLAAGNELLDKCAPWVQAPPPDTLPTREDLP